MTILSLQSLAWPPRTGQRPHNNMLKATHTRCAISVITAKHVACCVVVSPGVVIPKLPPRGPAEPSEISKCQRTDFQSLTLVSRGTTQTTAIVDPSWNESPQPRFKVVEDRLALVVGVGISSLLVRVEDFCSELKAGLMAELTQMPIVGSRILLSGDQGFSQCMAPTFWPEEDRTKGSYCVGGLICSVLAKNRRSAFTMPGTLLCGLMDRGHRRHPWKQKLDRWVLMRQNEVWKVASSSKTMGRRRISLIR